jgi:hypothetical protein
MFWLCSTAHCPFLRWAITGVGCMSTSPTPYMSAWCGLPRVMRHRLRLRRWQQLLFACHHTHPSRRVPKRPILHPTHGSSSQAVGQPRQGSRSNLRGTSPSPSRETLRLTPAFAGNGRTLSLPLDRCTARQKRLAWRCTVPYVVCSLRRFCSSQLLPVPPPPLMLLAHRKSSSCFRSLN